MNVDFTSSNWSLSSENTKLDTTSLIMSFLFMCNPPLYLLLKDDSPWYNVLKRDGGTVYLAVGVSPVLFVT